MPAAAVIPAPIAYIKIVAVKTLVVEYLPSAAKVRYACIFQQRHPSAMFRHCRPFTLRKLECSKQAFALNTSAWNDL